MKLRRDIFQAISDPSRRAILALLASQPAMTAGAIASNFEVARPTISKHIQILQECELVDSSQQGREIHYTLKLDKMKEVDVWLEQFRKIWENRFDNLDEILEGLKNSEKNKGSHG